MSSLALRRNAGAVVAAGAVVFLAAGASLAASPIKGRAAPLQAIVACRQMQDPTERLACFDAAAASLDAAEKAGEVVVVDRAQVQEARKAAFGFNFQMPSFMTGGERTEALDRITATVESAGQDATGKWTIRMTDGAVWRQVDNERVSREPKAGTTVEIRSATMGSFMMTIGYSHIRVHRDN